MTTRDWRHSAACRDVDPELFFPVAGPGTALYAEQVADAKTVCARCPVRDRCLTFALEQLPVGVAGGLDEHERAALRQQQRQPRGRADHRVCPATPPAAVPVVHPIAVLHAERAQTASNAERAQLGKAALMAGATSRDVAAAFRVSTRVVQRWRHRDD